MSDRRKTFSFLTYCSQDTEPDEDDEKDKDGKKKKKDKDKDKDDKVDWFIHISSFVYIS